MREDLIKTNKTKTCVAHNRELVPSQNDLLREQETRFTNMGRSHPKIKKKITNEFTPKMFSAKTNKTDEDGWGGPRIVSVCMIYACVLMDFLRFFSRLTCKLVKVLVELVPVPVLGDVAHEEPVVVVRDGHAHLPAFADLTTIELSWTDTRTHTHITTKNKLIKKSARNFTAFSSVHPPI